MYCDLRSAISEGATINFPRTTLGALPPPSGVTFPGLYAWSPISTSVITAALHLDRGLWATWRSRRLTPEPMPSAWFRPAPGRPLIYRVDQVLTWLAARNGEQLDTLDTWRHCHLTDFGAEVSDPEEMRNLAHVYARAVGPIVEDVRFTPAGFSAYLASLLLPA
jgi:hypothetical protein